ncbi:hypothetical protein PRNP1_014567 [Phytophthora ramorum]
MVKGSTSPSDASPATVGGSPLAESSSTRASVAAMEADVTRTVQFDGFDDDDQGREEEEEEKNDDDEKTGYDGVKTAAELREEVEEMSLQVSRVGNPRPVERSLAAELSEDADDEQGLAPGDRPPLVPKATRNAETPKANRVLARLVEEMRTGSRWMNMFAPMYMCQAKWPELSEELSQPINSQTIEQLVEDTVLLLRAMGYRCGHKPSKPALTTCNVSSVGVELMRWKRKLKDLFGMQGGLKGQVPKSRRADELLDEQKAPPPVTAQPYVTEPYVFPELSEDPSKVPLPKTPETKRGVFRRSEGTPYFADSHMQTPNKAREQRSRRPMAEFLTHEEATEFRRLVRADAVMASGRDDELSEDDNYADRREFDESPYDHIRQLSFDGAECDRGQVLEIRTHAPLEKIATFDGKRYRSDDALQWIKRFIYEMKGTCKPQDEWCEPFSLSLGKAAKGWYRQLPKKTQRKWSLLSEAFLDYYCSQFDQSARSRYYSARRRENEHVCDFLLRLNGYTRTAQIQYERGGADAADHVEHFLLSCGDDAVMDLLYPQRLSDIHKVEKIINQRLLGEKRKKQRDRLSTARSREPRRGDSRNDPSRRSESRRDNRRDDRRDDRRDRRDERRSRREDDRDRRVTLADASVNDLWAALDNHRATGDTDLYDSSNGGSDLDQLSESESDYGSDYIDAGNTRDRPRSSNERGESYRARQNSANRPDRSNERRDRSDRRDRQDGSRER